jgi:tetratricopeptide (TPR) repeat protein
VQKWIEACLAEEPTSTTLLLQRAEFLALRQDLAGAVAVYEQILAKEPRNVVALNNLAWILAADPQTAERALSLLAQATREVGLTSDLLDTRARVRITLKQFEQAERDLSDAIRAEPTALRWFHLALSRLGQIPAKPEDAARAFQEAKRRGLEPRAIHPADLPTYSILDAKSEPKR